MTGFKTWSSGDVLTSSDVNGYLMSQAVIVCTSGTRPSAPSEGMTIYETDTDRYSTYNGGWVTFGQVITGTYTPALTAATTNPTLGSGSTASGRYTLFNGNWCTCRGTIQFGTSGAAAGSGQYFISLPFNVNANITAGVSNVGSCVIRDSSASDLRNATAYMAASAATFSIVQSAIVSSSVPWTWAASDYMSWSITYETA